MPSRSGTLNSTDIKNWGTNLLIFISPIILLYLTSILGVVDVPNHIIKFSDFIPNSVTIGGMVVYALNAIIDILRKLVQGY